MKKDPVVFIRYIIESVELVESYTRDVSRDEFLSSVQLQDSVISSAPGLRHKKNRGNRGVG